MERHQRRGMKNDGIWKTSSVHRTQNPSHQRVQSKSSIKEFNQRVQSKSSIKEFNQRVQSKSSIKEFNQRVQSKSSIQEFNQRVRSKRTSMARSPDRDDIKSWSRSCCLTWDVMVPETFAAIHLSVRPAGRCGM